MRITALHHDLVQWVLDNSLPACLFEARNDSAHRGFIQNRVHRQPVPVAQVRDRGLLERGQYFEHGLERILMHVFHVEHMFWTVRGSDGREYDLSGGPPEGKTSGDLNEWKTATNTPTAAKYRDSGKVFWTAPQTADLCGRVDNMEIAVDYWNPGTAYNSNGPNSNSAFNAVGKEGGMPQLSPFLTPGATTSVPGQN